MFLQLPPADPLRRLHADPAHPDGAQEQAEVGQPARPADRPRPQLRDLRDHEPGREGLRGAAEAA